MKFEELSEKQAEIFRFATSESTALICDGAVRSGKTVITAAAFVLWAMANFSNALFGICSVTRKQAEQNIINPL